MENTSFRPRIPWFLNGIEVINAKDIFYTAKECFPHLASIINKNKYNYMDMYGFIYQLHLIDKETNKEYNYIGKKNLFEIKTLKTKNNKLPRPGHIEFKRKNINHKRVEVEVFKKESNWVIYNSSSKLVKDYEIVRKNIIDIAFSKIYLTYLECKYLFLFDALEHDNFLNENILGKFYRGKLLTDEEVVIHEQEYTSEL